MAPNTTKFLIASDGTCYSLMSTNGTLYVNGRSVWTNTANFTLAPDGTLYWLGTAASGGLLQRQTANGWSTLASNILSFSIDDMGNTYSLSKDGRFFQNGQVFAIGSNNHGNLIVRLSDGFKGPQFGEPVPSSQYENPFLRPADPKSQAQFDTIVGAIIEIKDAVQRTKVDWAIDLLLGCETIGPESDFSEKFPIQGVYDVGMCFEGMPIEDMNAPPDESSTNNLGSDNHLTDGGGGGVPTNGGAGVGDVGGSIGDFLGSLFGGGTTKPPVHLGYDGS